MKNQCRASVERCGAVWSECGMRWNASAIVIEFVLLQYQKYQNLYSLIFSGTIKAANCGSDSDIPNCTLFLNAINHFKNNEGDVLFWPEALNSMASDHVEPYAKVGTTAKEVLHAFGSWYRSRNKSSTNVLTLTETVPIDTRSKIIMLMVTFLVSLLFVVASRSKGRRSSNHLPWNIVSRMTELTFGQSTNLLVNLTSGLKFLVGTFLLFLLFTFTVYKTIFGTDLTISHRDVNVDTVDQFNESDAYPVILRDESMYQLILDSEKDESKSGEIMRVIKSRLSSKSFVGGAVDMYEDFVRYKSVIISSVYFHTIFERMSCLGIITEPSLIRDHYANYDGNTLINLYHVSDEKFLPIVTAYIYKSNISKPLELRLNQLFRSHLEYGITIYHQRMKTKLAYANDQIDHCINSVPSKGGKNSKIPDPVAFDSLGNIFRISGYLVAVAIIVSLVELFFWEIDMSTRKQIIKPRNRRRRIITY